MFKKEFNSKIDCVKYCEKKGIGSDQIRVW